MTDEEKAFEAFRITDYLCECMNEYLPVVIERFKKADRFPYFQRLLVTDDRANKWMCLYYMLGKEERKRKIYHTRAYTTYDVLRKHKEKDVNAGKGCIMFDPIVMKARMNGDEGLAVVLDIVPHAINRYTERHLKPIGKEGMEWGKKIEDMLSRWLWIDVCADLIGDKNAEKNRKDNICPFDVLMRGGGMLRGQAVDDFLIRFTTYVSEDMMFDVQLDRQSEMTEEYWKMMRYKKQIIKKLHYGRT